MERGRRLTPCSVANHSVRGPTGSVGKGREMLYPPTSPLGSEEVTAPRFWPLSGGPSILGACAGMSR